MVSLHSTNHKFSSTLLPQGREPRVLTWIPRRICALKSKSDPGWSSSLVTPGGRHAGEGSGVQERGQGYRRGGRASPPGPRMTRWAPAFRTHLSSGSTRLETWSPEELKGSSGQQLMDLGCRGGGCMSQTWPRPESPRGHTKNTDSGVLG